MYKSTFPFSASLKYACLAGIIGLMIGCGQTNDYEVLTEQTFNPDSIDHFVEPDFPFITTSIDARKLGPGFPSDNVTTRCLALQLGNEAYACFDTDMLRWSVAWTGDFLPMVTMAQISYRDFHNKSNEFPVVLGDPQIATGLYPGWSAGAPQFSDPRPPSPGPDLPSWGPIPAEMGRWNGVHVEGDEAVLSYTVSDTEILEKPGSITSETDTAFTRAFTISQPQQELSLVAAERQNGVRSEVQGNIAMLYHGTEGDSVTVVGLADSANAELQIIDNRYITMQISSSNQELTNTLLIWSGPAQNLDNFKQMLSNVETQIPDVSDGGEPHWEQSVHTKGQIAPDTSAFVTDKLTLPIPNHWNRNVRAVDIDFFEDNRAAIVTFEGDVWTVEGIDQDLSDMKWKRFASGLYEPQSIAVKDGQIYVFGREGIVRFHDLNNDGEADYYENFSNLMAQSMETREWPGSMVPAPDGGFYVSKGSAGANGPQFAPVAMTGFRYGSRHSGSVLKVSADGRTITPIADGLRMPYLGIHPKTGVLTASDQQGNFVPSSPIHLIDEGDYFGVPVSKHLNTNADVTPPLHWFPHRVDPSGAGQTWITSDQMGPLNGKLVHLSYGRPGLFSILFDSTDNAVQGAASVIPARYTAPTMKGAMNPGDGKLYITGFSLWGVNTEEISALLRVRHTGQPAYMPDEFKVRNGGVMIRFTEELDEEAVTNPANYQVKRWNYKRTENYGSGHYKLDGSPGEELLPVFSSHLSEDGKGIFLVIPDIREAMQMQVDYSIQTSDGTAIEDQLWFSVHDVQEPNLASYGFPNLNIDELAMESAATSVTEEEEQPPTVERGRELFRQTGCISCHSIDGNEQGYYGPTMQGLFGSQRQFVDTTQAVVDEAYIKQSILQPEVRVVEGFGQEMPSFVGILSENEIQSITMYIKSLSDQE